MIPNQIKINKCVNSIISTKSQLEQIKCNVRNWILENSQRWHSPLRHSKQNSSLYWQFEFKFEALLAHWCWFQGGGKGPAALSFNIQFNFWNRSAKLVVVENNSFDSTLDLLTFNLDEEAETAVVFFFIGELDEDGRRSNCWPPPLLLIIGRSRWGHRNIHIGGWFLRRSGGVHIPRRRRYHMIMIVIALLILIHKIHLMDSIRYRHPPRCWRWRHCSTRRRSIIGFHFHLIRTKYIVVAVAAIEQLLHHVVIVIVIYYYLFFSCIWCSISSGGSTGCGLGVGFTRFVAQKNGMLISGPMLLTIRRFFVWRIGIDWPEATMICSFW